jgi:plastocyanin
VPTDAVARAPARPRDGVVDQIGQEFTPKVAAILVGTPVRFPNHDNVRHHVYSFSPAKFFELPLYAGVPAEPVVFDKPGVVVLGCNIHDWMIGYVYVSESPYFAKTGRDGKVLLAELPPRAYTVRVWHPQLDAAEDTTRKTVDATRAGPIAVAWTLKLKRETKVRRAPAAQSRGRY